MPHEELPRQSIKPTKRPTDHLYAESAETVKGSGPQKGSLLKHQARGLPHPFAQDVAAGTRVTQRHALTPPDEQPGTHGARLERGHSGYVSARRSPLLAGVASPVAGPAVSPTRRARGRAISSTRADEHRTIRRRVPDRNAHDAVLSVTPVAAHLCRSSIAAVPFAGPRGSPVRSGPSLRSAGFAGATECAQHVFERGGEQLMRRLAGRVSAQPTSRR